MKESYFFRSVYMLRKDMNITWYSQRVVLTNSMILIFLQDCARNKVERKKI